MLLQARNLVKDYRRGATPFRAVNDVSLEIGKGDFICILGRSGSGKSTLLNLLAGLLTPTSGEVTFENQDYSSLSDNGRALLRNTALGYIMQGQSVLPNLTVLQNILLPLVIDRRKDDLSDRALSLMERVGISHLAFQYPASLSGGEMRRIAIVRALLSFPKLLIADEPTGDLDEETADEIIELFAQVANEGTAVLMVTHDVATVRYANHIFTMKTGVLEKQ